MELRNKYLNSLTSLRFLAIVGIVLFHIKYTMSPFFSADNFADLPTFSVAFFFALSGFVLTYRYDNKIQLRLKDFYIKRVLGIYPLHLLVLLIWCLFYFPPGWDRVTVFLSGIANTTLTQALFPRLEFILGYNAVAWFLSDLMIFYLLFPLIRDVKISVLIFSAVILFLITTNLLQLNGPINQFYPNFNYFSPIIRVADFCAGILAAYLFKKWAFLRYATFLELVFIFFAIAPVCYNIFKIPHGFGQVYMLITVPVFIYIFAHEEGSLSRFLANQKILVFLGEVSFSLYLWHHMIMRYMGEHLSSLLPPVLAILSAIVVSIVISIISFLCFEKPVRNLTSKYLKVEVIT